MSNIKCGKCGSTHQSVVEVKACYAGTVVAGSVMVAERPTPVVEPMVTEKQATYIAGLRTSRGLEPLAFTGTKKQASKEIERLLAMPKPAKARTVDYPAATGEPVDGIYIIRGNGAFYSEAQVFKVYKMVHGSGRQGVKALVIGDDKTGSFKYLGLAMKHLPAEAEKMGLDEAKEFGRLYGFCVRCGATLTDEGSIAAGIGPVCAGKGW